jgi:hypothetical protein
MALQAVRQGWLEIAASAYSARRKGGSAIAGLAPVEEMILFFVDHDQRVGLANQASIPTVEISKVHRRMPFRRPA